jgi:exodeoxyribonuclease-5
MRLKDIKVGGKYRARVSGVFVTVRVDAKEDIPYPPGGGRGYTAVHVTNLATNKHMTWKGAAKLRNEVGMEPPTVSKKLREAAESAAEFVARPKTEYPPPAERSIYTAIAMGAEPSVICPKCDQIAEHGHVCDPKDLEGEQRPDPTPSAVFSDRPQPLPALTAEHPVALVSECAPTSDSGTDDGPADPLGLKGDQRPAFDVITARIERGERVTKLCGYAGTGKTWLLSKIAGWAIARNFEVTVAAPTHKAAGVIADKLEANGVFGVEVRTIHSLLGLTLAPDYENDTGGRVLCSPEAGKGKLTRGLVICDEASMVGSVLKEHIDRTPDSVRWLFVGDLAQLPPVGEGVSELLDDPDATLETVLRQGKGSEITNLATRVRSGDLDMEYDPGREVSHVDTAEELLDAARRTFDSDEYRSDPSHARVLVFRNARRKAINLRMRGLLVGAEEPYVPGEWLVMYAAFTPDKSKLNLLAEKAKGFTRGTRSYGQAWKDFFRLKESLAGNVLTQLHVSEEVRVTGVTEATVGVGGYEFDVYRLTVEDHDGTEYVLPVLTPESAVRHKEAMDAKVAEAQEHRAAMAELPERSGPWLELDAKRRAAWGAYFTLEETFAQVDYAYAMTVHKSQGSTFQHAFVDVPDLLSSGGMQRSILYTAVTRPAKSLTFYA